MAKRKMSAFGLQQQAQLEYFWLVSATDGGMGEEGYYEGTSNDGMKGLGKLCVQWNGASFF